MVLICLKTFDGYSKNLRILFSNKKISENLRSLKKRCKSNFINKFIEYKSSIYEKRSFNSYTSFQWWSGRFDSCGIRWCNSFSFSLL